MAEEKIVEAVAEEKKAPAKKKAAPKKAAAKKEEVKAEAKKFAKATTHDFEVFLEPVITEKSMALMQNSNKVTVRGPIQDHHPRRSLPGHDQRLQESRHHRQER